MFLAQCPQPLEGCRLHAAGTPAVAAHFLGKMRRMPPRFPEKSPPKALGRRPISFSHFDIRVSRQKGSLRRFNLYTDGATGVLARVHEDSAKSFWVEQAFMPAFNSRLKIGFSRRGKGMLRTSFASPYASAGGSC
jgi:hypothetical protein